MPNVIRVGFLGAGGIAQAHAYALDTLKYYYRDVPDIKKVLVASPTPSSAEVFAERFKFEDAISPEKLWDRGDINTLYILGPNQTHTPQLLNALKMPNLERIYLEKPVAVSEKEIGQLAALEPSEQGKSVLVGFQFLQKSALRKAIHQWRSGAFGDLIHFQAEYFHSSYLDPEYRKKRQDRFAPIPINGAMVDMGSHALSLLTAFLGDHLVVLEAQKSGVMSDVPAHSDLCSTVMLKDPSSGAVGTLVASRISPGADDLLRLECWGQKGAILYDSTQPDIYRSYLPNEGWREHHEMSDYLPDSKFPSVYMPSGWLRAMVHNHYLFLGGNPGISFIPDLKHGIVVQRLLMAIAHKLKNEDSQP